MTAREDGLVVAAHGRHYLVAPARSESACPFLHCFPRGKKSEAAVVAGVSTNRRARDQGVIIKILPRRAGLCRSDRFKSRFFASNFNQLLFVLAAVPRVSEMLLGRALVAAHAHRVRALIVLNKTDLEAAARVARARLDLYRSLGYTALEISAKTQPEAARSQLEIRLKHQITLLLGPSGTGKSTLVNLLAPGAQAKTQEISTALRTGKHTTAFTRLYPLKNGGALIDSPGFQNFGLHHVSEKVFAQAFTEFQPFVSQCRFSDCRHLHEPECAVRTAVVARKIDTQRYALYAQLLREAQLTRFRRSGLICKPAAASSNGAGPSVHRSVSDKVRRQRRAPGTPWYRPRMWRVTAVQNDFKSWKIALEPVRDLVAERRHAPVFFWIEAMQYGAARVHDKGLAARVCDRADKITHKGVFFNIIEPDPVFDRDWNRHCIAHRAHALGNAQGLCHQRRAEYPALHARGRTAAIQVNFIVTRRFTALGAISQFIWIAAA